MEQEQIEDFVSRIECVMPEPGETGYLVSSKFVNRLRALKKNEKLPKIANNDLKEHGRLKATIKIDVDFFVVDSSLWNELLFNFGGGPEIPCKILSDGKPEIFQLQFNVKYQDRSQDLTCSREMPIDEFFSLISLKFGLEGQDWALYPVNCPGEIPRNEGVVGSAGLIGQKRLEVRLRSSDDPKPADVEPVLVSRKKASVKHDQLVEKKAPAPQGGSRTPPGLRNLGNSCYMNAALQALHCFEFFMDHLSTVLSEAENSKLTPVFGRLFQDMSGNAKVVNPQSFKTAIGNILPFLKGKTQEDACEFTTLLLDILKEESAKKSLFRSLFFGSQETETTCRHCEQKSIRTEEFSSLAIAVAQARRAIVAPFDLSVPMQRVCGIPSIPSILIGKTHEGKNTITTSMRPEFVEVYVLETPPLEPGTGYALTRLVDTNGTARTVPFLMSVPLNVSINPEELQTLVINRIKPLVHGKITNCELLAPPKMFTYDEEKCCCREPITVKLTQKVVPTRLVPTTGPIPVEELVDKYFSDIVLDVDNQWKCEGCGKESCALHRMTLIQCPKNLIIQLKRFRMQRGRFYRDDSEVIIPPTLDMSRYFKPGHGKKATYELKAVVNHSGTLGGGHYTAHGTRGGEWWYFNDATVTHRQFPSAANSTAYVLYYERLE